MATSQLDLYIEQAKINERSQSSTFDLTAYEVQQQLNNQVQTPTTEGFSTPTPEDDENFVDKVYGELDEAVEKGKKEFKRIVTQYNDSNNTLICFMLFVIIVLMFLNLVLD